MTDLAERKENTECGDDQSVRHDRTLIDAGRFMPREGGRFSSSLGKRQKVDLQHENKSEHLPNGHPDAFVSLGIEGV